MQNQNQKKIVHISINFQGISKNLKIIFGILYALKTYPHGLGLNRLTQMDLLITKILNSFKNS